ncbi:hypothetical protein Pla100_12620 [Neorhodopirellula pilleata]|uniref:Uncharacterized protein n=2 Tax=Neorhodopirellula pilleata TaxID=2714738 RepID=A0A5C6APS3_9BACT|nr:hypothetical protein Pla100_12620 [Neorhodopirellula pilleata]
MLGLFRSDPVRTPILRPTTSLVVTPPPTYDPTAETVGQAESEPKSKAVAVRMVAHRSTPKRLTVSSNQIQMQPYGAPTFDGVVVEKGQSIELENVKMKFDGKNTVVETDEYTMVFMSRTAANIPYFDVKFIPTTPFADSVAPHGLWGLTVDAGNEARNGDAGRGTQGGGAIDSVNQDGTIQRTQRGDRTSVELYEADSLFATQAKNEAGASFFRFAAERGTGLV